MTSAVNPATCLQTENDAEHAPVCPWLWQSWANPRCLRRTEETRSQSDWRASLKNVAARLAFALDTRRAPRRT
eukprot:419053-Lingulodinium_polyedra.AAC.1